MGTNEPPRTNHAIDYVEIAVADLDAAKAFYTTAFGWSLVATAPSTPASRARVGTSAGCASTRRSKPAGHS